MFPIGLTMRSPSDNSEMTEAYAMISSHLTLAMTKYQWHCGFRTYEKRSFGTLERGYDKGCSIWMSQRHSNWSYTKTSVKQHCSWVLSCLSNAKKLNIMDIYWVPPCQHRLSVKMVPPAWLYSLSEAAEVQTLQLLLPLPLHSCFLWTCDTIQWPLLGKPSF